MKATISINKKNSKTLYNYFSAKKILLAKTPNKYLLVEEMKDKTIIQSVSLTKRHIAISNKKTGEVLFPKNNS